MRSRRLLILLLWIIAFVGALAADRGVAGYVQSHGWEKSHWTRNQHRLAETIKLPGEYVTTLVVAVLLIALHKRRFEAAGLVVASGALSGANSLLKWIAGRRRPVVGIHPYDLDLFVGGWGGLTGAEKNLSFPSGHAALAFAMASSLAVLLPRWRWVFYAVACTVAVERVVENAHYLSDAVAGAAVGCLSTAIVLKIHAAIQARRRIATSHSPPTPTEPLP